MKRAIFKFNYGDQKAFLEQLTSETVCEGFCRKDKA
jgi:hypothetical protein